LIVHANLKAHPFWWLTSSLLACIALSIWVIGRESRVNHAVEASQAAPVLGILVDSHLRVLNVDWWSPAKRAGIQPGDVLRKMGGVTLPNTIAIQSADTRFPVPAPSVVEGTADLRSVFHRLVPTWEHTVTVTVDRDGRALDVPILVTEKPFNYDPANPQPMVTPVPASLDSSEFYL
jgi:S1-C subfamily serine protease